MRSLWLYRLLYGSIPVVILLVSVALLAGSAFTQTTTDLYLPVAMRNAPSKANIFGTVYNAIAPSAVQSNVQVCIKFSSMCAVSDQNGNYRIDDVPSGPVVLVAFPPAPPTPPPTFNDFERVVFLDPNVDNEVDIPLSPYITLEGQYIVILTWKSRIEGRTVDLDANFWLPPGDEAFFVTKYDDSLCNDPLRVGVGNYDQWPNAFIDVDSVDGTLPETISIAKLYAGFSTYAVRNFSMATWTGGTPIPPSLSASGAKVELYDSSGLAASFSVPTSPDPQAIWWKLFEISDIGEINVFNEITGDYPVTSYVCLFQ
jgi:hypothetical protein